MKGWSGMGNSGIVLSGQARLVMCRRW